jgi:PleD family two-component response regulator
MILNLVMPGTDGLNICRKIRENHQTRDIKIIAITGDSSRKTLERIKKEGVSEILTKPFEYQELLSRVKKLSKS